MDSRSETATDGVTTSTVQAPLRPSNNLEPIEKWEDEQFLRNPDLVTDEVFEVNLRQSAMEDLIFRTRTKGETVAGEAVETLQEVRVVDGSESNQEQVQQYCQGKKVDQRCCTMELSFVEKMAIRDTCAMLFSILLTYVAPIQEYLSQNAVYVAIFGVVFALRPFAQSSVGYSIELLAFSVVLGLLGVAVGLLVAAVAPSAAAWYIIVFFFCVLGFFYLGSKYKRLLLPIAIFVVFLSANISDFYFILNNGPAASSSTSEQWRILKHEVKSKLVAYNIPIAVHFLCSMLIFPWFHQESVLKSLQDCWPQAAKLLELSDSAFQSFVGNSPPLTAEQEKAMFDASNKLKTTYLAAKGGLFGAQLETRFKLSGDGEEMKQNLSLSLTTLRSLRRLSMRTYNHSKNISARDADSKQGEKSTAVVDDQMPNEAQERSNREESKEALLKFANICSKLTENVQSMLPSLGQILTCPISRVENVDFHFHLLKQKEAEMLELIPQLRTDLRNWISVDQPDDELKMYFLLHIKIISLVSRAAVSAWKDKEKWIHSNYRTSWAHKLSDVRVTVFHLGTSSLEVYQRGPFYDQENNLKSHQRAFRDLHFLVQSMPFRNALKAAISSTFLISFAFIPSTQEFFHSTSMTNAMNTLFSALRQVQMGLMIERVAMRFGGILVGYIIAGIAFEIACAASPSDCNVLDGWIFPILGLPIFPVFFVAKIRYPRFFYAAYSILKEYFVIATIVLTSFKYPSGTVPGKLSSASISASSAWELGGYITMNTLVGGVTAVFVGTFLFPITGSSSLRNLLSKTFQHFVFLLEANYFLKQLTRLDPTSIRPEGKGKTVGEEIQLLEKRMEAVENYLHGALSVEAATYIPSIKLEPLQLRHSVKPEVILKVLEASMKTLESLWTIRRLIRDPVAIREFDPKGSYAIKLTYLELFYLKMLTSVVFELSLVLSGSVFMHVSPPALRTLIANPDLAHEHIKIFKRRMLGIESHPVLVGDLATFSYLFEEISRNLAIVLEYTDSLMQIPPYTRSIREMSDRATSGYYEVLQMESETFFHNPNPSHLKIV